ncbi:MAG: hypothetical protein EHM17_00410 [Verrucomicrobiaceae bacterium]|nr:MAG: hypothetical protein EHM17_16735 [Verrucomicrobiaceae bacterium]RPJ32078.1 MAG: hypothetical protein EHM17_14135 [Verrucomicrobiaceae bacterium]RPJ35988.1 MAG: hypothetical protein EHM17_00410 [Verrucomicrobiaceae bacterium]
MPVLLVQLLHLQQLKALVLLVLLPQLAASVPHLLVAQWVLWLMSSTVALVKRQLQLLVFPLPQVLLVSAV